MMPLNPTITKVKVRTTVAVLMVVGLILVAGFVVLQKEGIRKIARRSPAVHPLLRDQLSLKKRNQLKEFIMKQNTALQKQIEEFSKIPLTQRAKQERSLGSLTKAVKGWSCHIKRSMV